MATALAVGTSKPFTHAGRTALQKILAVLRQVDAESTRELAARVRLFDSGQEGHQPLAAVERAIVERRVVEIEYVEKTEEFTARTVEPVAVLGVQPHWYLWAFCRLRQAPRAFRLDRIRSATILDDSVRDRDLDPTDIELPELISRGILGNLTGQATNN
ncbi:MAG: helix-turn-helix transcriptional regulator [Acidimicrobiia bacterium]